MNARMNEAYIIGISTYNQVTLQYRKNQITTHHKFRLKQGKRIVDRKAAELSHSFFGNRIVRGKNAA